MFEKGGVNNRKALAYMALARILLVDSADSALQYITLGIQQAKNNNDPLQLGSGYELLSWYYLQTQQYQDAVRTSTDALIISDTLLQSTKHSSLPLLH